MSTLALTGSIAEAMVCKALFELGNHANAIAHMTASLEILESIQSRDADKMKNLLGSWREKKSGLFQRARSLLRKGR